MTTPLRALVVFGVAGCLATGSIIGIAFGRFLEDDDPKILYMTQEGWDDPDVHPLEHARDRIDDVLRAWRVTETMKTPGQ